MRNHREDLANQLRPCNKCSPNSRGLPNTRESPPTSSSTSEPITSTRGLNPWATDTNAATDGHR